MFFNYINQIMTQGVDLTIVIRKSDGQLTISTLPKVNGLKDEAQNRIIPLTLTGTPTELDAGFFPAISQPIQKASGLITNMVQFEKQAEKAVENSKAAKEQNDKQSKEAKEKKERYDKHMKKADEHISAKNHNEALTSLAQARLCASEQDMKRVDDKMTEVKAELRQGSLFDMKELTQAPNQPQMPTSQPIQNMPTIQQQQPVNQQPIQTQTQQQYYQSPQPEYQPPQYAQQQSNQRTEYIQPQQQNYQIPEPYPTPIAKPEYCREDEYSGYLDFPANMQPPMANSQYTNPQM